MEDVSEEAILKNCPHCDPTSQAFQYLLQETSYFYIVCDSHAIVEGHILIIPKQHVSCVAEYPPVVYDQFLLLYKKASDFLKINYHAVSTFEHGKFGQTVFHSHVHFLPFDGSPLDIVPEGQEKLRVLPDLSNLKELFKKDGGYLFFSIGTDQWSVDVSLVAPRFFRDRFANALGRPERGNWKAMRLNKAIMKKVAEEATTTQHLWKQFVWPEV